MKKLFVIVQFALIIALGANASTSLPRGIMGIAIVSAADNSQFQNTSPWFVSWRQWITGKLSGMEQWWAKFIGRGQNNSPQTSKSQPINDYPALTGKNTSQPNLPFNQSSGGGGGSGGSDEGNGTPGSPYKIEPNQFKKYCGQNTYVLYWRKGGEKGKDMTKPTGKGGGNEGARDYWQLPTCEELAECHCCCNTCKTPESKCQQDGWVFNNKGCPPNCKPKCEGDCKPKCESWTQPKGPGDPSLNRDCKCQMEGCPKSNAKDCQIIIMDPGKTDVEYTKKDGNPEQYFKAVGAAYFKNGNGSSDPKSKIIAWPNDKADPGYVSKLKDDKGKCCKCYQDGPPIGGGGNGGGGSQQDQQGQPETSAGGSPGQIGEEPDQINRAAEQYLPNQMTPDKFRKNSDGSYTEIKSGIIYRQGSDGIYRHLR